MCFPVNFAKFLTTPFLTEHLRATTSVDFCRELAVWDYLSSQSFSINFEIVIENISMFFNILKFSTIRYEFAVNIRLNIFKWVYISHSCWFSFGRNYVNLKNQV